MTRLPAPRSTGLGGDPAYAVAIVCLGNICRSPIADVVLREHLAEAGLDDRVAVASFGTGGWHEGERMDPRSADVLAAAGYDGSDHRAHQVTAAHAGRFDVVLGMDTTNVADLHHLMPDDADRVLLFRDLDPSGTGDVPDPYAGGPEGFTSTLAVVERTSAALVRELAALLATHDTEPAEPDRQAVP